MSVPPKRRRSLGGATLKAGNAGLLFDRDASAGIGKKNRIRL
jgi:hypothetical protein